MSDLRDSKVEARLREFFAAQDALSPSMRDLSGNLTRGPVVKSRRRAIRILSAAVGIASLSILSGIFLANPRDRQESGSISAEPCTFPLDSILTTANGAKVKGGTTAELAHLKVGAMASIPVTLTASPGFEVTGAEAYALKPGSTETDPTSAAAVSVVEIPISGGTVNLNFRGSAPGTYLVIFRATAYSHENCHADAGKPNQGGKPTLGYSIIDLGTIVVEGG